MREIKSAALIGLGAIGGYVAPKLETVMGHEGFTIIADGKRKERLENEGCTINDVIWKFSVTAPEDAVKPVDLLIFSVKYHGLEQAIEDAKKFVGENTILMSLLNGVESEEILRKHFPKQHILYSIIRIPSIHENGKISYPDDWGEISFGDPVNHELSEDVKAVKNLFEKAQIGYQIPEDMLRNMWHKFMTNVSENQIAAVLKAPYGIFQISREANHLRENVAREVIAIAQAKGIDLKEEDLLPVREKVASYPFQGKPSTMQDIEHRRKTEVDMFAGAMLRMGKEMGIPTPYNQMLFDCIKALETWNDYQTKSENC